VKLQLGCLALAYLSMVSSISAQKTGANVATTTAATQAAAQSATAAPQVPRLVKFSGTVQNFTANDAGSGIVARDSASVPTNVIGVTFSLYSQQTGGVALWSEVQNVRVDNTGRYTVQLGSTQPDGLPVELFNTAQAQWLGVRQEGQAEQPRIMLLSVPYALEAADAETFGGKPPSAFMSALNSGAGVNGSTLGRNGKQSAPTGGGGTTNYIALWTSSTNLGNSVIYQGSNNIGIGTTSPGYPLTVSGNNTGTIIEVTQAGSGVGVNAYSNSTSGGGTAVRGKSQGKSGIGVRGDALASTGATIGVYGTAASDEGIGVEGFADDSSGSTIGVYGAASSQAGTGVYGYADATAGNNTGVYGRTTSPEGDAVYGDAASTTGANVGVNGVTASLDGTGVYGQSTSTSGETAGVVGEAASSSGTGVVGHATSTTGFAVGVSGDSSSTSGVGVTGSANAGTGSAFGVKGTTASTAGVGVYGISTPKTGTNYGVEGTNASPDGAGVSGDNSSTTGNALGVWGTTDSPDGIGVYGLGIDSSNTTVGERPIGVWGNTNQDGAIGVLGTADNSIAVSGNNNASSVATADFENEESTRIDAAVLVTRGTHYDGICLMDVSGNLNCTGSKSAVVPVDGGSRRVALYAVEAPENWFEDMGSAQLAKGSAVVKLEPTFAQTVNSGVEYHVFLTPKGDCKGLYVTNETASSFEVRELGGGRTSIAFDYRIVARRKGYEDIRLADKTELLAAVEAERKPVLRKSPKPTIGSAGSAAGATTMSPRAGAAKRKSPPPVPPPLRGAIEAPQPKR